MPSQLVALATQARKASGLEALELDDLDEELPDPDPHMPMSACLQLPLPFELVNEFDVAKQVPHLAMLLFTAFSHIADSDEIEDGQPVTNRRDSTKPTRARFMRHPTKKISTEYSLSGGRKVSRQKRFPRRFLDRRAGPRQNYLGPAPDCTSLWTLEAASRV
jgi:hypothetical protein